METILFIFLQPKLQKKFLFKIFITNFLSLLKIIKMDFLAKGLSLVMEEEVMTKEVEFRRKELRRVLEVPKMMRTA